MKTLIVDDEPLARARLARLLENFNNYEIVAEVGTGIDALQYYDKYKPDVIFLDIRMPGMDGIETAHHLSKEANPPAVIFTTAYTDHALEAFEAQAVDYLLKPIRKERLEEALKNLTKLNRAQLAKLEASTNKPARRQHICARMRGNLELIPVEDIYYFQADQKYVMLRHHNGSVLIEETLKQLETEFSEDFIRVHRNALIAKHYVHKLEKTKDNKYYIVIKDIEEHMEVSRRHVAPVRNFLRQH